MKCIMGGVLNSCMLDGKADSCLHWFLSCLALEKPTACGVKMNLLFNKNLTNNTEETLFIVNMQSFFLVIKICTIS